MNDDDKERKLKQANDNVKYLESQLTPLVESNAKLKESIHALQFYMEQRRQDFAQLLSYSKERQLKINLSDMIDVYHWLKKDIENYQTQIKDLETENSMFKMFIQQQDEEVRKEKKDLNKTIIKLQHQIEEKENLFVQSTKDYENEKVQLINKNQIQLEDQERKSQKIIRDLIQEKEEIAIQYKQLDDEYQQKQKKLKLDLINQYDKQERQIQIEHQKITKELNDQIQKLDIKNRQLLTELQGLKQDYSQVSQQSSTLSKANSKLTRQVENLLQTLKGARDEIQSLISEKSSLNITIEQLKQQIEKHIKKESEYQQYIKGQQIQFSDARDKFEIQIQNFENENQELKSSIQKKELCIEQLSEMNVKIDQTYQDKLNKQRIKYEQILYPNKVTNKNMLLYQEVEVQHDDFAIKDFIEDYELQLSQYAIQLETTLQKLKKLEDSFDEKQNAMKKQFDSQIKKITKECEQKLMKEIKQQKQTIEEMHQKKQQEFDYQQNRHKNEVENLNQEFINKTKNLREEIENLNAKIADDHIIIDQLNQLINTLQENLTQQKKSHDQQLDMLRSNYSVGKEQLTAAFEERFGKIQSELKTLQIEKEDFAYIQQQDQKVINEQKKKVEILQQNIAQQKEENKQQSQLIQEQCYIIDQLQQQIQRLNDQAKHLSNEVQNSKQVYNIFRNTTMAIPRVYDDYNYKTEIKKVSATQLKLSRTKQVTRQANRPTNHNSSMNFIISNGEQQLPKVRSTSTNQIKTTPRHHSTQS